MIDPVAAAEQKLSDVRAKKIETAEFLAKKRKVHVENVANGAKPSEIARSRADLTAAENADDDAVIAVQAAEDALQAARQAAAEKAEAQRQKDLAAAWNRKDSAGLRINQCIAALADACHEFDAPNEDILRHTTADHRAGQRDYLLRMAQRFLPAVISAVSPEASPSTLSTGADHLRIRWNDKRGHTFYVWSHSKDVAAPETQPSPTKKTKEAA
jgi:hypothetical protein